jgi:hypothetical protein
MPLFPGGESHGQFRFSPPQQATTVQNHLNQSRYLGRGHSFQQDTMNQQMIPDNPQQRFLMVKQFGDVLNQLYHKPPLTGGVDAGELFGAAWLALEMTGLPEGVAVPGIQYKMGPEFSKFNRSVLPTVNLNWPGIFGIYETIFRSTFQDPVRAQELSTEYRTWNSKWMSQWPN